MASNLRVDTILPSTGTNVAIGTASGSVTFLGDTDITTSGSVSIGGVLTYEDVTNVDSVGVITARQGIRIGAGKSIGSDGAAVVYYGDGSNLTGAGPTLTNGADNRVITATSASAITGESNLTFNGGATGDAQLTVHAAQNDSGADSELILETSNDFATSVVMFKDSTAEAGSIAYNHGDNYIKLSTNGTNGGTERMRISAEGYVTNPARPCFDVAKGNGHVSSTNAIVFDVVNVNNGSHYNTSNGRFTAPVTGTYFLYFGGIKANSSSVVRMKLLKNGTGSYMNADREMRFDDGDSYGENASMNVIVSLTANDYVQVYVTEGTMYGTDASYTHFGGYLLS